MDAPSFKDLQRVATDKIVEKNSRITKDIIEREGSDANALVAGMAAVGDEVVGQMVAICAAQYLETAKGEKLTRLVFDRYGLVRKPAAPALGSVRFSTTAPVPVAFSIPTGTKLVTVDGRQYITTVAALFPQNTSGPVFVAVRAITAGVDQQARKDEITNILDIPTGAPSDLVVTNPIATAGGANEEQDEDLRARARAFFTTVRRGTISAIQQAALAVPGVVRATAIEILDELGRPAKRGQLIIADQFTDALVNTTSTTYETQSQILAQNVFQGLYDARAMGIFIDVFVAQVILQSVILALSFEGDADIETVALSARAAIVNYINSLNPGASFVPADAVNALKLVPGLIVTGNEILSPPGPVVPALRQVLRTSMGLVKASTVQPDRALQGNTNPDAV